MPYLDVQRLKYAEYFDWYEGRTDTLFTGVAPSQINGLEIVQPSELTTRFNYFAAVSRFFSDAQLGDIPDMDPTALALLETATRHWSVTGEACFILVGGRWSVVRPDYVHPIFNPFDRDIIDRFLIVYPQRRNNRDYPNFDNRVLYADTARVIEYDVPTGQATLSERRYRHGWVADLPTGAPVPIGPVIWVRTGDGIYQDIEGIVREITVRLNVLQSTLNSTAFSLLQIDKDSIGDGVFLSGVSASRVRSASRTGLGLTVAPPFIGEEGARYIERTGVGLEESLEYLRMLLGQLGVLSGVPDYVFGVQLGRPADENERVLFAGQAKVNRFRQDIQQAFELIGFLIRFSTEPFITRMQRQASIIAQFEAGLINLNEARIALGRFPLIRGNGVFGGQQALAGGQA